MAVYFATDKGQELLKAFNARIDQTEAKGKITTWKKSTDGNYTHTAAEWHQKAWMKPQVESTRLVFNIVKHKDTKVSTPVYGYYHGHLIETFLNHFDEEFADGKATALPATGDNCSSD